MYPCGNFVRVTNGYSIISNPRDESIGSLFGFDDLGVVKAFPSTEFDPVFKWKQISNQKQSKTCYRKLLTIILNPFLNV